MQQENIVEKIKKLLNMAKLGSKHEREVAYLKAQEMMAKYHIEQDLLEENKFIKVVEIEVKLNVKTDVFAYLAEIIASNFKCKTYVRHSDRRYIKPVFLGLEIDAQVASEIFKDAYTFAKNESTRVANYYYKLKGYSSGVKGDWMLGFVRGLNDGFTSQIQISKETALMIVIPEEVKYAYQEIKFSNKPLKIKSINYNGNSNIEMAGYENGYNFSMKRRQKALSEDV